MAYPHGLITWTDLSSPDVPGAKAFYSATLGWEADDIINEGQVVYTMFRTDGKLAAGLGKQSPEMTEQGFPPLWTTYINVDDVDAIASAFADNGGELVVAPVDVMDNGRMAYGMDPTGAPIGFWQAGNHAGAEAFNDPGFLTWSELTTRDSVAARDFYTTILPWRVTEDDMGGFMYYTFWLGERPTAGIMTMDETWPDDLPAHWMTYFRVADADATVVAVEKAGGKVPVPPFDSPVGKVAVVNDPSGGTFSIVGPAPEGA